MILDSVIRLPLYSAVIPGAAQIAAAYLAWDPSASPCEVREKNYDTKPDEKRRFEVHERTIDLMIARAGAEVIHIAPREGFTSAEPLSDDGCKLDGPVRGSAVILTEGRFCAILPGEAHAVGGIVDGAIGSIDKWVVKVRL